MPNPRLRRHAAGASLVEVTVVMALVAVLARSVLPGWSDARDRRSLQAASAQLANDLHLARSLAAAQGLPVRLGSVTAQGCYVVHTGPARGCACNAAGAVQCSGDAQALRVAVLPGSGRLAFSASSASMLFDADRGTVTPTGTLRLQLADGRAIHHVVNIMGRARTCSPRGAVPGHPPC
jgi:type IV fimbrial biogenesis protein FimT